MTQDKAPQNWFSRLLSNDTAIKLIFDHFRNLGIVAVIYAAAGWALREPGSGWLKYFNYSAAACLAVIGSFLLLLNERHGWKKLEEVGLPLGWDLGIRLVYGGSFIFIVGSIASSRAGGGG